MDAFLVIAGDPAAPVAGDLLDRAAAAVRVAVDPGAVLHAETGAGFVFAAATGARRSDAAFAPAGAAGGMTYVAGPVRRLGDRDTGGDDSDRRVAAVRAALAEGDPGTGLAALTGSFHAVVHDPDRRHTTLVTDRLASRPVFAAALPGARCWSSDLRCLLALPGLDPTLDLDALAQLVRLQTIFEDRTLYRAIAMVAPGSWLRVDHRLGAAAAPVVATRYWSLSRPAPFSTFDEAIDATAEVFRAATRRLVAGSERATLLLSGGLDSRILLAALADDRGGGVETHTFGLDETKEGETAHRLAGLAGVPWSFIPQRLETYWTRFPRIVATGNALSSAYHGHTSNPAARLAESGVDTALNGWELDLLFSGSYFPKERVKLLGRTLYTSRIRPLRDGADVVARVHGGLDIQPGGFGNSFLCPDLQPRWEHAATAAIGRTVERARRWSDAPHDWLNDALFVDGIAKFRSAPVAGAIRSELRERSAMYESDVLDAYLRLPVAWRVHGKVFRRALLRLDPALARVPYSNTGANPTTPPMLQAVRHQARMVKTANWNRVKGLARRMGLPLAAPEAGGGYAASLALTGMLNGDDPAMAAVRRLLVEGPLVSAGIVRADAIAAAIAPGGAGTVPIGAFDGLEPVPLTLLNLASLAMWLDGQPWRMP